MQRHIILLERDPVVAEDIAETVAEVFADATLRVALTVRDAAQAIAEAAGESALAILHATEAELNDPVLIGAEDAGTVRTIAIHRELDHPRYSAWVFLPLPFTTESLREALLRATR